MKKLFVTMVVGLMVVGSAVAQPEGDEPPRPPPGMAGGPPLLAPEIRAMLESMTEEERSAAFAKVRTEWLAGLSAERRLEVDAKAAEMEKVRAMSHDERKAYFDRKRDTWLASLTPEERAAHDARKAEMDTVRQLTRDEQHAYFAKRRQEFAAMSPEQQAKERALRPPGPLRRR